MRTRDGRRATWGGGMMMGWHGGGMVRHTISPVRVKMHFNFAAFFAPCNTLLLSCNPQAMPPHRLPGRGRGDFSHSGDALSIIAKVRRLRVLTRAPQARRQRCRH